MKNSSKSNLSILLLAILLTSFLFQISFAEKGKMLFLYSFPFKGTVLDTMPDGIFADDPVGKFILNTSYFGEEFEYELGKSYSSIGLFSKKRVFRNSYEIRQSGSKDFILKNCSYSVTIDSGAFHDHVLDIECKDSAGTAFFLLNGINLKVDAEVKTWFNGRDKLIGWGENHKLKFLEYNYETEYGNLNVYPDTTVKVMYERGNEMVEAEVYPYYASFNGKKTLIRKDIGIGDDGDACVIWVGDLDSDGIPDLLMDVNKKYSMNIYILMLSSIAEDGQLYGLAGRIITYSC